jgi:hypothetical protein
LSGFMGFSGYAERVSAASPYFPAPPEQPIRTKTVKTIRRLRNIAEKRILNFFTITSGDTLFDTTCMCAFPIMWWLGTYAQPPLDGFPPLVLSCSLRSPPAYGNTFSDEIHFNISEPWFLALLVHIIILHTRVKGAKRHSCLNCQ